MKMRESLTVTRGLVLNFPDISINDWMQVFANFNQAR